MSFGLQDQRQCMACVGCQNDSDFDYCRACGYTTRLGVVKLDESKPVTYCSFCEKPAGRRYRLDLAGKIYCPRWLCKLFRRIL